ncbi:ankyrin repeat-containing domain protein [Dendryphion nanum]|uniref:Ankyrin repeat-containing domain protein n=1 Tax=Dendryphion nanum TaxID=256645 RepID=A0A9P9DTG5_9PLEO|nr:ankyrin repeat-containing domain protein [Dendryphion nanum]
MSVPCRVKVFVTSRREMDIVKAFEDRHIPTIPVLAENVAADIEAFARSKIKRLRSGEHGKALYIASDELEEKIAQTLAKKADGMFLWVNLQLDNLCRVSKARMDQEVESALARLPKGLPKTYVRILERIEEQPSYMKALALNCLAWMIYAQRPLTTRELQYALATTLDCKTRQDLQPRSPGVILDACGNLLEETNGVIRPIHYTVQEFLITASEGLSQTTIRAQLLNSSAMHTRLSLVCLTYIRLVAFEKPAQDFWDLYDRLEANMFAGYASQSFDYHISVCHEMSPDVVEQLEKLFQQESQYLAAVLQIKILRDGFDWHNVQRHFDRMSFVVSASTIVYSTALYNVPAVKLRWVEHAPPDYALHLASSAGLIDAVVPLLDAGCDINERDGNGGTPLYHACSEAHIEIVHTLLRKGADVNAQGGSYGNALQAASYGGHKEIVRLLIDEGAEVNTQGGYYGNALQTASERGHKEIVRLLVDEGAEVNAQGGEYGNALQAASYRGDKEIVRLLVDKGAITHERDAEILQ